jgi:hypothetical protein
MAVGFPAKTTYANGDVFSASDINDTNGTLNLLTSSTLSRAAAKNAIINGGMDIWQRGTSSTTNNAYGSADRWYQNTSAGSLTWSRESTIVPAGSQYSMKILSGSAGSGTFTQQVIETLNVVPYAGKTVTLSASIASSASTSWGMYLSYSTSTDVGISGSWTDITATSSSIPTTTSTTFQTAYAIYSIPSTAKSLRVMMYPNAMANGTAAYFGNVQLELGSTATTFTRAGGTIQGELAACQRYYFNLATGANKPIGSGTYFSTTSMYCFVNFPVTMRTAPAIDQTTGTDFYRFYSQAGGADGLNSVSIDGSSPTAVTIYNNTNASGTNGQGGWLTTANNATSFLSFTAEL